MLEHLSDLDLPLDESLEERLDGDIFVFQKRLDGDEEYRLPTCKDYFRHLFYQVHWGLWINNTNKFYVLHFECITQNIAPLSFYILSSLYLRKLDGSCTRDTTLKNNIAIMMCYVTSVTFIPIIKPLFYLLYLLSIFAF